MCICFSNSLALLAFEKFQKSREKLNNIVQIINKYSANKEDLSDTLVKDLILKEIASTMILTPVHEAKEVKFDDIADQVMKKVSLRFPDAHKDMQKKISDEADTLYKTEKINNFVSVKFMKGSKMFSHEGIFFGYGFGGKSVNIGHTFIPVVDLVDEDRAKFDEVFNKKKKKEYIDSNTSNYYKQKNNYIDEVRGAIEKQICEENEMNGYIFAYGKWRTAKNVAEILIGEKIKIPNVTETPAYIPETASSSPVPLTPVGTDSEKLRSETLKKAEDEWMRITNTYPGIDGDQGQRPALWYMTGEQVNLLMSNEFSSNTPEVKVISYPANDPISSIELHFFHNYFYKVITKYRPAKTIEAMVELANKIRDKYGPSDDIEKEIEEKEKSPAEVDEPKPEEPAPDAPVEIPLEEIVTWTGKITKGTLLIRRNNDAEKTVSEFTFTKENPRVVEEISQKLEKERKEREKREREEELERYRKFRN